MITSPLSESPNCKCDNVLRLFRTKAFPLLYDITHITLQSALKFDTVWAEIRTNNLPDEKIIQNKKSRIIFFLWIVSMLFIELMYSYIHTLYICRENSKLFRTSSLYNFMYVHN